MSKWLIGLFLSLALGCQAATNVSQIMIPASYFYISDWVTRPGASASTTEPYFIRATGVSQTALAYATYGSANITGTVTVVLPQNVRERPGNLKLYGLFHSNVATGNNGTFKAEIQQQSAFNNVTVQTLTVGTVTAAMPNTTGSQFRKIELAGFSGVNYRSNRPLGITVARTGGDTGIVQLLGLIIEHDYNYGITR